MERVEEDKGNRLARTIIRVSLKGNRGEGTGRDFLSPEMQNSEGEAFAKRLGIAHDNEVSLALADINQRASRRGSWLRRPNLQQHLKDAEEGLFTDAIFYKVSRAAREMSDGFDVLEAFTERGVRLHFVGDSIPDVDTPVGKMAFAMYLFMAENESKSIGDYLSSAIKSRWTERKKPHGRLHLWLKWGENKTYVVDDEGWRFCRRVVELGLEGIGYRKGARQMNAEGFLLKNGKPVAHDTFMRLLNPDNLEKLLGTAVSYPMDETGRVVRLQNAWPALISEDEAAVLRLNYERVEARRSQPLHPSQPCRSPESSKAHWRHACSGVLRCAFCGVYMLAGSNKRGAHGPRLPDDEPLPRFHTYNCPSAEVQSGDHGGIRYLTVGVHGLDDAVLRVIAAEYEPAPNGALVEINSLKQKTEPLTPRRRTVADVDAEIEVLMARSHLVPDRLLKMRSHSLEEERNRLLLEEEYAKTDERALTKAMTVVNDEEQVKRLTVKALVKEAVFPFGIKGKRCDYRCVRVTLKNGKTYLAPIHRVTYQGIKDVYPVEQMDDCLAPFEQAAREREAATMGAALLDEKQDAEVMGTIVNIADGDVSTSAQD